ncbi:MAG: type pilus modification protein PilV [Pseudomonadota bacterium]|jgi:type IV pilus assembly protein PilV
MMQKTLLNSRVRRQRGLTLMEVLVTMMVMALGLLGIAGLQTSTMRYQLGSTERSNVALLLADFAERVRANLKVAPGEIDGSRYLMQDAEDAETPAYSWDAMQGTPPTASKDCDSAACTADELAEFDMAVWRAQVRKMLPGGVAQVSGTTAQGLRVTLAWRDKDHTAAPTTCASGLEGIANDTCCPASLQLSADMSGVRCANFTVKP